MPPLGLGLKAHFGGASSSSPITILTTSLVAWYRADLLVTQSGGVVSAYGDSSGTGDANKNATQGTPANQPAFNASNASYGNQPTITYTGSQRLVTGTWATALTQPYTLFMVGHTTDGVGNEFVCGNSGAMDVNDTSPHFEYSNTVQSSLTTTNTPSIVWMIVNGASSKVGVRANTANGTGDSGAGSVPGITIGNFRNGGIPWNGPQAELVVASGALSQGLINQMTAYMAARYSLTQGP